MLSGAELPEVDELDGVDISDVLLEQQPGRFPLHFYWFRREIRAVRRGPWKLNVIVNEPSRGTRKPIRLDSPTLYQLIEDPGERHDVAAEHPELVRELLDLIEQREHEVR